MTEFDRFSDDYDEILDRSLGFGGGSASFFHRSKARIVREILGDAFSGDLLDFGCGIGNVLQYLVRDLPGARCQGFDPSEASIARAATIPGVISVTASESDLIQGGFDAVVIANVLHHIDPDDRDRILARVLGYLRPRGRVIVFEHNPLNPLTRRVVRGCPFDEGVILLHPAEVRDRLSGAGATRVRQRYITFFPQWLSILQGLERWLGWLPLGAQTCTLGQAAAEPS